MSANKKPFFNIVLYTPEIPGNTGSIGRTCVALNLRLILIGPYGFDISEKAVRRAGLDYWKHVNLKEYSHWQDFLLGEKVRPNQLFFFENFGEKTFYDAPYEEDCYLLFGAEVKGFPQEIIDHYQHHFYSLPMFSEHIRSLNLSNVATAVAYECLRHLPWR